MRCPWLSQLETAFQTTLEDIKGRLAAAACILTAARACLSPWLQLVAAFRATLEEIQDASLLLHVVDVSHPNAPAQVRPRPAGLSRYNKHRIISPTAQQIDAVNRVLEELGVQNIPTLNVWNKVRG